MASVTRKFRDDFEAWAANRVATSEFSLEEMADFKEMLRRDLAPGPDQLRAGQTMILTAGVEIPATIDDHEERYRLWADYFSAEAKIIWTMSTCAAPPRRNKGNGPLQQI